jgi:hypothetical protein
LDNLVLTGGTRLFKAALFVRTSPKVVEAIVCDKQRSVASSDDMAQFWIRFLGCEVLVEPRIATQRWFDATVDFVNAQITDPVVKNDVYEHLISELKSNRTDIVPQEFGEDYLPDEYQAAYADHLQQMQIAAKFDKDTSDIQGHLRKRAFYTANGVIVTAPAKAEKLVKVKKDQIVVNDQLRSIAEK